MTGMKDLFGDTPFPAPAPARAFDGATYHPQRDYPRLSGQQKAVYELMRDGMWRTLDEVADAIHATPQGASARLRDLRKSKYGSHRVEREHVAGGLYRYRMCVG